MPPWVQVSPQANPTSCSQLAALRPKGSPESLQGAPSLSSRRTLPSKVEWGVEVVTLSSLPAREDKGSSFSVLCMFCQACYTAFIPRSLPIRPHGRHLAVVMSSQSWGFSHHGRQDRTRPVSRTRSRSRRDGPTAGLSGRQGALAGVLKWPRPLTPDPKFLASPSRPLK